MGGRERNEYWNESAHKVGLEKKILPSLLPGLKPETFQSRVQCSNHWAIPSPQCSTHDPLFCKHRSVQNTILPNKVQWLVPFLIPGSSYLEPAPCFYPSFYFCQFFQIFLESLSLLKTLLFSPIALIYTTVSLCVWERSCCLHWTLKICAFNV